MKLSIIVPFYDVEPYIEDCIRSLYVQDMPRGDYEVIAVDDCSPDNSVEIVKRLQGEYENLRLVRLPRNRKLGGARNAGIDVAKGDYIMLVDSDDYIAENILMTLYNVVSGNGLDFAEFRDLRSSEDPKKAQAVKMTSGSDLFFDKDFCWWISHVVAWNKIYSRNFLNDNNIRFAEGEMYEDNDFAFQCFAMAGKVAHLDYGVYCYRNRPESFVRSKVNEDRVAQRLRMCVRMADIHRECAAADSRYEKTITDFIRNTLSDVQTTIKQNPELSTKKIRSRLSTRDWLIIKTYIPWKMWLNMRFVL